MMEQRQVDDEGYKAPNVKLYDLDEATMNRIERNDPDVAGLSMHLDSEEINTMNDWHQLGIFIGNSKHLKDVDIVATNEADTLSQAAIKLFFRGLASNRSIERLAIFDCSDPETLFATLTPFFEHNSNLRCLELEQCHINSSNSSFLRTALSKFNKNALLRLELGTNNMSDICASNIISELGLHRNLVDLSLSDNNIGRKGCAALAKILKYPGEIMDLDLSYNNIDDECMLSLTSALSTNSRIKTFRLGCLPEHSVTAMGWHVFSNVLYNPICSLEQLWLDGNNIDDQGANALANALANNSRLKRFNFGSNRGLTPEGWHKIWSILSNPASALEILEVPHNNIDDQVVLSLRGYLGFNTKLRHLDIGNSDISSQGWRYFFGGQRKFSLENIDLSNSQIDDGGASLLSVLANSNALKTLDFGPNSSIPANAWCNFSRILRPPYQLAEFSFISSNTNDEVLINFANALANNTTLSKFSFDTSQITSRGWRALSDVICNKSSIESIYDSNHMVQIVEAGIPADLEYLLRINKNENKADVARKKILKYYFFDGDTKHHEITGMDIPVLPHALKWIGRDQLGFTLLYCVLRGLPSLLDSERKIIGGKRKHNC